MFSIEFVALAFLGLSVSQAEGPVRGTIKKVDAEKGTITLSYGDGKETTATASESTRFMAEGKPLADGIKNPAVKAGSAVMFLVDRNNMLVGLRIGAAGAQPPPLEKVDTKNLKPLTELGNEKYKGFAGGLYPGGKNSRPEAHEKAGVAIAKGIQPLDSDGKPSPTGKIVLLSVGMSNTTQEFSTFKRLADGDKEKNASLVIVDGAQGGQTAARIKNPDDKNSGTQFWNTVDGRLKTAGVGRNQVQAAWIKEADAGPRDGFPKYAETLRDELRQIVQAMHVLYPNLKVVYLSSRIYAGYAKTPLNPEPYAYESGLSVKWLIEEQIDGGKELAFDANKGQVKAPWLSWGPYLWANGTTKRNDGLTYEEADFAGDGTHPSAAGQRKVADQLLTFFKNDPTTRSWFLGK